MKKICQMLTLVLGIIILAAYASSASATCPKVQASNGTFINGKFTTLKSGNAFYSGRGCLGYLYVLITVNGKRITINEAFYNGTFDAQGNAVAVSQSGSKITWSAKNSTVTYQSPNPLASFVAVMPAGSVKFM